MSHDIPQKTIAPFAAKIEFKPSHLWQGKHQRWTFRSDEMSEFNAPAHKQYANLEKFLLKDLKGTYFVGTIFDNRFHNFTPTSNGIEEKEKKYNLVLQVYQDRIKIDHRKDLDLSWLEPTFDRTYLDYLAVSFEQARYANDLRASNLREYANLFKENQIKILCP